MNRRYGHVLSALLQDERIQLYRPLLGTTLKKFGSSLLQEAARADIRFCLLREMPGMATLSATLCDRATALDEWPQDEAGYFSPHERMIYLRSLSPVLLAREFGHAVDYALGGGKFYSEMDDAIRSAFRNAYWFVSSWAGSSVADYFAESLRFYIGIDQRQCRWFNVSRATLQRVDPTMYGILTNLVTGKSS